MGEEGEAEKWDSDSDSGENEIIEFVGEYRLGTDRFLYARYSDGICRRVSSITLVLAHCPHSISEIC